MSTGRDERFREIQRGIEEEGIGKLEEQDDGKQ